MAEPNTKSILVSYLERNKVLKIPSSKERGVDLKLLENEFIKYFNFESNVHLVLSFHRYDEEWQDYIELDQDCTLMNKEKLKVIVSPLLTTPHSTDSIPHSTDSSEVSN